MKIPSYQLGRNADFKMGNFLAKLVPIPSRLLSISLVLLQDNSSFLKFTLRNDHELATTAQTCQKTCRQWAMPCFKVNLALPLAEFRRYLCNVPQF
jgi:hypothetical protein